MTRSAEQPSGGEDEGEAVHAPATARSRAPSLATTAPVHEAPWVPTTLVQYETPSRREDAGSRLSGPVCTVQQGLERLSDEPLIADRDRILHCVLPPRDLGGGWLQFVSQRRATRFDARDLTEVFEHRLRASKAREAGVCPVRRAISSMCFDELIRQVTVDCGERGALLLRLRDELRMTADAHRCLFDSSVEYGRRKAVEAEKGRQEMVDRIESLQHRKQEMQREVKRLEAKLRALQRCCQEQQEAEQKKYSAEISFLQQTHKRLSSQEATIKQLQDEERKRLLAS
eukprot:TRINITY_DN309_c0_g3_i1.p2 TRINITY_DN309_c0_g3~~TRINITY_DN309_c0_g3_i1.p2  ORF type:complete len:310 (+),score=115.36 TRINITY_DN309_c0_g3_i1:73-930(+)